MTQITNNKSQTGSFRILILIFVICFGFSVSNLVFAKQSFAQDRIPLVVAPARTQISLDPGGSETLLVKFFNESTSPLTGSLGVVDFIVTGKEGKPLLLDNIDYPLSNQYSGASWIKLPLEKASITPGEVLSVNYKINVPDDAKPGGRYVAVYFESNGQLPGVNLNSQQASATSSRIVALLYIRVNGPITESAFADLFKVPTFIQFGPIPVSFDIFNKGNYHITPTGQVTLTDWFGKTVDQKIIEEKNIFPDTRRSYEEKLGSFWMFGKYKVNLASAYGDSGKTINTSSFVWVVPIALIIALILGITVITLAIILINRRLTARQHVLETKLEQEISELESLKNKFKDQMPRK